VAQIESILTSTKDALLLAEDYTHFDSQIIMHINSAFSTLQQLGVGPANGFQIVDKQEKWTDLFPVGDPRLNFVHTYIYLRVKLVFDPPATSFAIEALDKQVKELEWRFTIYHDVDTVANGTPVVVTPPVVIDPTPALGAPSIWNLTGLSDFPAEAPINAVGIDFTTGDIWTKTS